MAFCDFVVKYDPAIDKPEELTKRILYSVIVSRLKANKPVNCFVGGDSGEGKSLGVIRLQEILCEIQGIDINKHFDSMNVFTPLEYPKKIDGLLYDKDLKKVNMLCLHEAREVVKAKLWHSFITQAVADVNAMSRSIKRICTFIISQFIRDITNDIRYTLNYYIIVRRPKQKRSRMYIHVLWKDDRDLEKPKLRKRKLSGYLVYPNGRYQRYVPQYLEMSKPNKELVERFDRLDFESKAVIIRSKLDRLIKEMKTEIGEQSKKVDVMVDWYIQHPDNLPLIGKRYKNGWRVKPETRQMHELSDDEAKRFEFKLNERLKQSGVIDIKNEVLEDG